VVRAAFLFLLAAAVLVGAGCGAVAHMTDSSGNAAQGKVLFKMSTLPGGKPGCATCHTLADAGTSGTVGPNLDDAFGFDKKQGFDISTIRDVVRGQIAYATSSTGAGVGGRKPPGIEFPGMPDNLATGQNARDIAAYVGACSGLPILSGKQLAEAKQQCDQALRG
jgi:mono/diheme cytochrome c family protein